MSKLEDKESEGEAMGEPLSALNTSRELVKQTRKHKAIYRHFKKGLTLLIFDELEKLRRYWSFRVQYLIQAGFKGELDSKIRIEGNTIKLIINVTIPEEFIEESVNEILNSPEYNSNNGVGSNERDTHTYSG